MKNQRRTFDFSFKLEVVHMIKEQGLIVQNISRNMNIGHSAIRRMVTQYDSEQRRKPGISNPRTTEQQCIRQLEQKIIK